MKRTSPQKEQQVLTQILLGQSYPDISKETGVPASTIKKIRARHKVNAQAMITEVEQESVKQAKASLQKARDLLGSYLDEALMGLRHLSINEMILVSNQMFIQVEVEALSGLQSPQKHQKDIYKLLAKLKKR
jgi:hypothetical protein